MKLLLVEDEITLARPLIQVLTGQGYMVDHLEEGNSVEEHLSLHDYDCLVLDLNLPGKDGLDVAKSLRANANTIPILMLTARAQQQDKLTGFEVGTDDYLTKPFNMKELLLRISALIRRSKHLATDSVGIGELKIDFQNKQVTLKDVSIDLQPKEFQVLEYLARNLDKPISAEELLEHVWDSEVDLFTSTVKTHIKTLRQKIDPYKCYIVTKRGQGYMLVGSLIKN